MSDSELNKSEDASPYKLQQARRKGVVARSPELGLVLGAACAAAWLWARGDVMAARVAAISARSFATAGALSAGSGAVLHWSGSVLVETFRAVLPLVIAVLLGTLVANLAQVGFLFAPTALKADPSRLNPVEGLKKLFSVQVLIEALKTTLKVAVYGWLAWYTVHGMVTGLLQTEVGITALPALLLRATLHVLVPMIGAAVVFAAIDQVIVRRMFSRKMRMSKHEVKQEHRQREGDPRIKQRRKQLQRELLKRSRSMRGIRTADLVVANPTHLVVALRYEPATMAAPIVVAKGAGDFAMRLRKLAFIHGVPVVESKAFAREVFRVSDLDTEIPAPLYRAAAALYMHLRRQRGNRAA
jgi:flagellar biosynthesis protein FlhB